MQILLLNTNPVVSRLIALCLKDRDAELYEFTSIEEIEDKAYDLAFVDDAIYDNISLDALQKLRFAKLVLLTSHPEGKYEAIDIVIKKPFLPSKIIEVIDSLEVREEIELSEEEASYIFPFSEETEEIEEETEEETEEEIVEEIDEEENDDKSDNSEEIAASHEILDINEIEKIKSLLEMEDEEVSDDLWEKDEEELEILKREVIKQNLLNEGLEIVDEEDMLDALEKDVTLHITHDIQESEREKEEFERKLMDAVKKMKIKKLKKLLKGAEVTINIKFKDSE